MTNDPTRIAIIGGGISGLTTAFRLLQKQPNLNIDLYEKNTAVGGKIASTRKEAFLFEHGPNGFMNSRQEMLDLCRDLGLEENTQPSEQAAAERYLLRDGKLNALPKGPGSLLSWQGLSLKGKLRLLKELLTKSGTDDRENLYDFACRHFGKETADYIVDPFTTGVYGTASRNLEVRSVFPLLHELDREKGSLIRAAIARKKAQKRKCEPKKKKRRAELTSFKSGMQDLTDALRKRLLKDIRLMTSAEVLSVDNKGLITYLINDEKQQIAYDAVLTTCPADTLATICQASFPKTAQAATEIPYTPIVVVACGFNEVKNYQGPKGFGYLVPPLENSPILGLLLSSFIYKGRAPEGGLLCRLMIGGDRIPEAVNWSDERLRQTVLSEIGDKLGIAQQPDLFEIIRWNKAIPAYTPGHYDRLQTVIQETAQTPLFISGNAFYGVSMNDCVKHADSAADEIIEYIKSR